MSDNPYEPGEPGLSPPPASSERPTAVKVFGILNLVFAVIGICGLVFSSAALAAGDMIPQDPNFPNPTLELINNNPGYRMFLIVTMGLGFVFTIVLAAGGVGLLQYRRYGRSASVAYGWYVIISALVGLVANYLVLIAPMMEKMQQLEGQAQQTAMGGAIGGAIGGVFGACGSMIYPIILLVFMYRRRVIDSLS